MSLFRFSSAMALAFLAAVALTPAASAQLLVDDFENGIGPGEFVFGGGEFGALSATATTPDGSAFASQFEVDIDDFGGFTGWGQPIEGGPLDASGFANPVVELDVAATGTFQVEINFQNTGGGGNGEIRNVIQFVDGDGTYKTLRLPLASFIPTNPAVFDLDDIAQYVFTVPPVGAMGDGDSGTLESVLRIDNVRIVEGPINSQTDLVAYDFDDGDFGSFFFFAGGEGIGAAPTTDTPDGSANAFSGMLDGDEYGGFAGFGATFPGSPLDVSGFESYNFFLRTNGPARIEVNLQTVEGSGLFEARETFFVGDTGGEYEMISIPLEALAMSGPNPPDFSQVVNFVFTFVEIPGDGDPGTSEFAFDIDALGFGEQLPAGMPEPEIAVSPTAVDFGDVNTGSSAQATVTITNEGDADLTISDIGIAGGEFVISSGGAGTLAPGAMQDVVVEFAPTFTGAQTGTLTITSDDADEGTVTVDLTGNGVVPPPCGYVFEAGPKSSLSVSSAGGQVRFIYTLDNSTNSMGESVDIWARVVNENGTTIFVRGPRTIQVPGSSIFQAGYNQRIRASVADGAYAYTILAGTYDDLDPAASEVCGSETFTVTKGSDAPLTRSASGAAAKTLAAADWQEVEIVDETVIPAMLAVEADEVLLAPNPTRDQATFAFSLAADTDVTLRVFDARGREAAVVLEGPLQAGAHTATLARRLPAGVYMWQLQAGDRVETGRLTIVR